MHRFYVFHSLTHFHRNAIAIASLFLAAKVEEQPRKLEHVIKVAHLCLHRDQLDVRLDVRIYNINLHFYLNILFLFITIIWISRT